MKTAESPVVPEDRERTRQRGDSPRSCPSSGASPSPLDATTSGVGELYLDLYDPPPLASTTQTFMLVYASVRAILEGESIPHAQVSAQAARDAAAQHIERALVTSGGPSDG